MAAFSPRNDLNASGLDFLLVDLNVAMTFMDVADATGVEKTARRNHENARRAYDTVVRLLRNFVPTAEQRQILDEKLSVLKRRLQAVGQQF